LKYNQCLSGVGFQRLAARALAVLRAHPAYRLIVDLRDNLGGDSQPFQALISGIWADRAINRRGRIFGLINDFTASSAALDSYNLRLTTNALLIGQQVATPINESGKRPRAEAAALRRAYSGHKDGQQPSADQDGHPGNRGGADAARLARRARPSAGRGAGLRPDPWAIAQPPRLAQAANDPAAGGIAQGLASVDVIQ
jgi:hypothetical protein